jgi:hypothetical protein
MEKPLKFLVRTWVQGKGCVHQRSAAMSEWEARELLEVGRGAIDKAQQSGGVEQISLTKGRAYVKARRIPDPDEPGRMAPGFVLASIPDPAAFISEVVAREFEELLRSAVEATLDQTPTPGEGELGERGWKIIHVGRPPSDSKDRTRSWERAGRYLGLIALIVATFAVYSRLPRPWQSSPSQEGRNRGDQAGDRSDPEDSNWKEVQQQIKQVLEEDWARKLIDRGTSSNDTDRDLLRHFAGLFQRPDLKKELSEKDFRRYGVQDPSDHPFVAFLGRLPVRIPALQDGEADLTPTEAMDYLKKLDRELMKSRPYHIDLDLNKPETTFPTKLNARSQLPAKFDRFGASAPKISVIRRRSFRRLLISLG